MAEIYGVDEPLPAINDAQAERDRYYDGITQSLDVLRERLVDTLTPEEARAFLEYAYGRTLATGSLPHPSDSGRNVRVIVTEEAERIPLRDTNSVLGYDDDSLDAALADLDLTISSEGSHDDPPLRRGANMDALLQRVGTVVSHTARPRAHTPPTRLPRPTSTSPSASDQQLHDLVRRLSDELAEYHRKYPPQRPQVCRLGHRITIDEHLEPLLDEYDSKLARLESDAAQLRRENDTLVREMDRLVSAVEQGQLPTQHSADVRNRHIPTRDEEREREELGETVERLRLLQREMDALVAEHQAAKGHIASITTQMDEADAKRQEAEENLHRAEEQLRHYQAMLSKLEAAGERLFEGKNSLRAALDELADEKTRLWADLRVKDTEIAKLTDQLEKLQTQHAQLSERHLQDAKANEATIAELRAQLKESQARAGASDRTLKENSSTILVLTEKEAQTAVRCAELQAQLDTLTSERDSLLLRVEELAAELRARSDKLASTQEALEARRNADLADMERQFKARLEALEKENAQLAKDLALARIERDRYARDVRDLKEIMARCKEVADQDQRCATLAIEELGKKLVAAESGRQDAELRATRSQDQARKAQLELERVQAELRLMMHSDEKHLRRLEEEYVQSHKSMMQEMPNLVKLRERLRELELALDQANRQDRASADSENRSLHMRLDEALQKLHETEQRSQNLLEHMQGLVDASDEGARRWRSEAERLAKEFEQTVEILERKIADSRQEQDQLRREVSHLAAHNDHLQQVARELEVNAMHIAASAEEYVVCICSSRAWISQSTIAGVISI
eukprot:m.105866 g.105866  ORF g.105866 m.105866 type:complete len:806 (-) comp9160_c0_seq2:260-2677(-)